MKVLLVSGQAGAEICRFYGVTSFTLHLLEKPFKPIELLTRAYRVILSDERIEVSTGGGSNPTPQTPGAKGEPAGLRGTAAPGTRPSAAGKTTTPTITLTAITA